MLSQLLTCIQDGFGAQPGEDILTSSTGIRIVVQDSQDTDPVFSSQRIMNVQEGLPTVIERIVGGWH